MVRVRVRVRARVRVGVRCRCARLLRSLLRRLRPRLHLRQLGAQALRHVAHLVRVGVRVKG